MKNFTLMILCAGFGSRMLNLTRSTPKPLLKYKNKILLKNTIDFFTNIGCDEILINTHYLHNKIKKYLDKNYKKYPIQIIYEKKLLNPVSTCLDLVVLRLCCGPFPRADRLCHHFWSCRPQDKSILSEILRRR